MSDKDTIFRFDDVSFGYHGGKGKTLLVEGFTGSIKKGELAVIIGRNGTGKSTLLKSMARLIPFLSGHVFLHDKPLTEIANAEFPRLVSFVSTDMPRNPVMTVYELVSLGRFPYTNWLGSMKKEDHEEVTKALGHVHLLDHAQKPLYRISDGERQRAMIARTLAQNSPVIILDEPTAFLDLPNKYELISLLSQLTSMGRTIIFSTHDTGIALRFPDKLFILDNKAMTSGAPEDQILSGTFGNIFQSPGFKFSLKTGDVEVIRKKSGYVSISCDDSIQKEWTVRALKRAGYGIGERSSSLLHIEAKASEKKYSWRIENNNSDNYFYSIYDLRNYLNQILN